MKIGAKVVRHGRYVIFLMAARGTGAMAIKDHTDDGGELRLRQQLVSAIAMNREQALLEEKNDIPILNMLDPGNLPIEKSGPVRSKIVMALFLLSGLAAWGIENREWIKKRLFDGQEAETGESQ